ncbi:TlpA family protein disulfide reductase [Faecalimicrobium sp. JNUCC 81]
MINIGNTGCGPCIEEMPEIEKLYKGLPKDININSICADVGTDYRFNFAKSNNKSCFILASFELVKYSLIAIMIVNIILNLNQANIITNKIYIS